MTTVDTSGKIVTSIMSLELLESTKLDYIEFWCIYRGVSKISAKGVYVYKGTGCFSDFISFFKYSMKMK